LPQGFILALIYAAHV